MGQCIRKPCDIYEKKKITEDEKKTKEIELYIHPNTEVDKYFKLKSDTLRSEIKKVFGNDIICNNIISELNIRSVDELISINQLSLVLKLGKSTSNVDPINIPKLKKLIADLKIKYQRSSSSNGS